MAEFRATKIAEIRAQVGGQRVLCGLSGGVDSAVAAVLIHEAIGEQLTCVFVDHGLMRAGEADQVVSLFRGHYNIPLVHVNAETLFLNGLAGVSDPEAKRSEEHTSELQSLMRNSYAVFCLKKKKKIRRKNTTEKRCRNQKIKNKYK